VSWLVWFLIAIHSLDAAIRQPCWFFLVDLRCCLHEPHFCSAEFLIFPDLLSIPKSDFPFCTCSCAYSFRTYFHSSMSSWSWSIFYLISPSFCWTFLVNFWPSHFSSFLRVVVQLLNRFRRHAFLYGKWCGAAGVSFSSEVLCFRCLDLTLCSVSCFWNWHLAFVSQRCHRTVAEWSILHRKAGIFRIVLPCAWQCHSSTGCLGSKTGNCFEVVWLSCGWFETGYYPECSSKGSSFFVLFISYVYFLACFIVFYPVARFIVFRSLQCLYRDLRKEFRHFEKDILGATYDARNRTIFVDLKVASVVDAFIQAFDMHGFRQSPCPENKLIVSYSLFIILVCWFVFLPSVFFVYQALRVPNPTVIANWSTLEIVNVPPGTTSMELVRTFSVDGCPLNITVDCWTELG